MNKIYKVIWNEARKCYVVVAEIAKNHGKNNVRSIVERLAAKSKQAVLELFTAAQNPAGGALPAAGRWAGYPRTAAQWIVPLMTAGILLQPMSAQATEIERKSGAGGVIEQNGNVYNIYAQEIATKGDFGVNRFNQFSLDKGHIANMHFNHKGGDTTVSNLVNLVENRISISGTVNAIKSGKIDGNLYFISPKGMYLGPSGVINAGSFTGIAASSDYFNKLWDHTYNIGTDIEYNDDGSYKSGGLSSDLKNFGRRSNGSYSSMSDLKLSTGEDNGIKIEGQINTRSGIVLGAGNIQVVKNAVLQSKKDIEFSSLVNTSTADAGLGSDLDVSVNSAGDIILRAENTTSYTNNLVTSDVTEIIDTVLNSTNETKVEVAGSLQSDGNVDVSASATSEFDNTSFDLASKITNVDDLYQEFLSEMGINWAADWAKKDNSASVKLANTGSITAGGDAYLQADAKVDVKVKASTTSKTEGTSTAIPVLAVAVGVTDNKAAVDVEGAIQTGVDTDGNFKDTGNLAMAANAETKLDISASASAQTKPTDAGNQIVLGVSWATGNNKAELNIKEGDTIKAGGDISATASSSSEISSEGSASGKDETFASAAISVLDYDSAANVNIERSMEGKSITSSATNSCTRRTRAWASVSPSRTALSSGSLTMRSMSAASVFCICL